MGRLSFLLSITSHNHCYVNQCIVNKTGTRYLHMPVLLKTYFAASIILYNSLYNVSVSASSSTLHCAI